MRLWHKDLISVLPKQQLVAQWRELSAIVGSIQKHGTPNHLLVNKILDFPISHFEAYVKLVDRELVKRNYQISDSVRNKIYGYCYKNKKAREKEVSYEEIYEEWHNIRYLMQCYYNLQEKYDCGGISDSEWKLIESVIKEKCT